MSKRVRKAVLPVAGLGTRVLPGAKTTPKNLLNVVDRPILSYVVAEARAAGIEHLIFIVGRGQTAIEGQAETLQQRLVVFAAEHRRLIDIAIQSLTAIQTGNIGTSGPTGTLLAHALGELRSLTDRTLPEIHSASPAAMAA